MKQVKKLVLSKETLAVLTDEQVGMVGGGRVTVNGNCESIPCGTDACNVSGACGGGGSAGCGGGASAACASGGCMPASSACDPTVACMSNRCNGTRGCIVNR